MGGGKRGKGNWTHKKTAPVATIIKDRLGRGS